MAAAADFGNSRNVVETTISAVATCIFQILSAKDDAGITAEIFQEALVMISKVEGLRQRSSQMALYTAAREYFEVVPRRAENQLSPSTDVENSGAREGENRSGKASMAEAVESFSTSVVMEILTEASIDGDHESLRQARIRMVLAFVRQPPCAETTPATVAAREKIKTALEGWRSTERSRPLQKDIDEALEAK